MKLTSFLATQILILRAALGISMETLGNEVFAVQSAESATTDAIVNKSSGCFLIQKRVHLSSALETDIKFTANEPSDSAHNANLMEQDSIRSATQHAKPKRACAFAFEDSNGKEWKNVKLTPSILKFQSGSVSVVELKGRRGLVFQRKGGKSDEQGVGCLLEDSVECIDTPVSANMALQQKGIGMPCSESRCVVGTTPLDYARSMIGGALNQIKTNLTQVVIIGQGIGGMARWFSQSMPEVEIHSVDNSADVIRTSPCFNLYESPKMHLVADDGRAYIDRHPEGTFSVILVDAVDFTNDEVPSRLSTVEFFQTVRSKLAPGGVLAMNVHNVKKSMLHSVESAFETEQVYLLGHPDTGIFGFLVKAPGRSQEVGIGVGEGFKEAARWMQEGFLKKPRPGRTRRGSPKHDVDM